MSGEGVREGTGLGPALPFDADDPLLARAAWSRLAEPADEVAGALVAHLGASGALAWLVDAVAHPGRHAGLLGDALATAPEDGLSRERGAAPDGTVPDGAAGPARRASEVLAQRAAGWATRLPTLDPRRELRVLQRAGGALVVPGDPRWPAGLDDLGTRAPFALWVRGDADLAALARRSVALVGARASTSYGEHVTADLATGLVDRGFTVVSGGAYGVDAAAHRGTLLADGSTVAVLAGGVDRLYPQGNHDLLRRVADGGGSVVSEVPPGSAPFRQRFLSRNRLIAGLSAATVVVEAALRSGALSTARHAAALLRPVGAVPGPVTSMASAGCHALLRDGAAVCVTDAAEVAELAGALGDDAAASGVAPPAPTDGLDDVDRLLVDALPVRQAAPLDAVARAAGLPVGATLGGLGRLELRGLAEQVDGRWRRPRR